MVFLRVWAEMGSPLIQAKVKKIIPPQRSRPAGNMRVPRAARQQPLVNEPMVAYILPPSLHKLSMEPRNTVSIDCE